MSWKLLDVMMGALCVVAVVASFVGWHAEFPWLPLVLGAGNIMRMRREEHVPYPTSNERFLGR